MTEDADVEDKNVSHHRRKQKISGWHGLVRPSAFTTTGATRSLPYNVVPSAIAQERLAYFNGLQKVNFRQHLPNGRQANTLLDLMTIRAFNSEALRSRSLGTAVGFRIREGSLTTIPAIIVFVARKVNDRWLDYDQKFPTTMQGPVQLWCDVDVVEFSDYYAVPTPYQKEQLHSELLCDLRGSDYCIGSGSQVASNETYGTLGAIVRSQKRPNQLGFLTNRHVAVNLHFPAQNMFHPLPPSMGPGVYLGNVERATSFMTDDLWYGIFAGRNPDTFVRVDGAFIPFADSFDLSRITTFVKGIGEMGDVIHIELCDPIASVVSKHVTKVGRSSGVTRGRIMAYSVEYNCDKGICFFTDFLIVGDNRQKFDWEGDSGSLILLVGEENMKPQPIGMIWGGTASSGRLQLDKESGPENWTSGVDLGRLLDVLQLDLITSDAELQEAVAEQVKWRNTDYSSSGVRKGSDQSGQECRKPDVMVGGDTPHSGQTCEEINSFDERKGDTWKELDLMSRVSGSIPPSSSGAEGVNVQLSLAL